MSFFGRKLTYMQESSVILDSMLTCPRCGHQTEVRMPTDACQLCYECSHCHALLKPKPGGCCVFCSYGSVPCPPKQQSGNQHHYC